MLTVDPALGTLPAMAAIPVRTRRVTRGEYERMIECGIFRADERLELVDGWLVVKEPQSDPHAVAVDLVGATLRRAFGDAWLVRAHAPLALGVRSRPEPDVSVVPGPARRYVGASPRLAALVVEVARSSLRFDRARKAAVYARAGVRDYWIVNLVDRVLEVHRDPVRTSPARGWRYRSAAVLRPSDHVTPLAVSTAVAVADLLP
jgi:Uma2 family endonuclease